MKLVTFLFGVVFCAGSIFASDNKALELRIYHIAPGKVDAQVERFEKWANPAFLKYNFKPQGYWLTTNDAQQVKLIYLLQSDSREKSKEQFKALGVDADFKAGYKGSAEKHGTVTEKVRSIFLESAGSTGNPAFPTTGVTELRLYTLETGKSSEFIRKHESSASKSGAKLVGIWTPEDEDKWPNLVVMMLNHKSEKATKSKVEDGQVEVHWMYPLTFNSPAR